MKKIFTLFAAALLAASANAQTTYTLDINQIYSDASGATGSCPNATNSGGGTKYLINDATIEQGVFTVVSKENRTYRVDVIQTDEDKNIKPVTYSESYTASYRLEPNGASNNTGGRQMFLDAAGPGKLYIGAWGNEGRSLIVMKATDKTSYNNVANMSSSDFKHTFTADETKAEADGQPQVFEIDITSSGIYCITQDAGIYFGYVSFVQTGEGGEETPKDPTSATVWDFSKALSEADAANLAADATNWKYDDENGYWTNNTTLSERNVFTALTANGAELDITKGLLFTRDNATGLEEGRIRITPEKNFAVNGGKIIIKLGELVKNDVVKIRLKGAGDSERELTPTNLEVTEGSLSTADTEKHVVALKVITDGVVTLTTGNGFQFFALTINADLPEDSGEFDGIATLVLQPTSSVTYNLAGQKVSNNFKGIAIKNGKKVVTK